MAATYLKRDFLFELAADELFKQTAFREKGSVLVRADLDTSVSGSRLVAASDTVDVDLGGMVALRAMFLKFKGSLVLILNGTINIPLESPTTETWGIAYLEGEFTSLSIQNPSSADGVELIWALAGNRT